MPKPVLNSRRFAVMVASQCQVTVLSLVSCAIPHDHWRDLQRHWKIKDPEHYYRRTVTRQQFFQGIPVAIVSFV